MSRYLSLEKAKQSVIDAVERQPHKRNPTNDSGSCLYTSPTDANDHCIIGQVLADNGLPVPDDNADANGFCRRGWVYVEKGYMSEKTKTFLGDVQAVFDNGYEWFDALDFFRNRGLL